MNSGAQVIDPERLFRAHVEQLIAWIKRQLKGRVQSVSARAQHAYSGQPRLPAASVKDGRVIVTYYEGNSLQPIDVYPAPGANACAMVSELQQAFSRFQPHDPVPEREEEPPSVPDRSDSPKLVALPALEDYFEKNQRIAWYDRQHGHLLSIPDGQFFRLEVSGDGCYVQCAVRVSDEVIQYHLNPSAGLRAAELLDKVAAWLGQWVGITQSPPAVSGVSLNSLDQADTDASEVTKPPADVSANPLEMPLRGLREHFRVLQGLGCTRVEISADSTCLVFLNTTTRRAHERRSARWRGRLFIQAEQNSLGDCRLFLHDKEQRPIHLPQCLARRLPAENCLKWLYYIRQRGCRAQFRRHGQELSLGSRRNDFWPDHGE